MGEGTRVVLTWPASPDTASGEARAVADERDTPPTPSAPHGPRAGTMTAVALDGALAVPCTRNPL